MQQDTEYKYTVRVHWKNGDTVANWNEKCAQAIELFGMPGHKFITHPTSEYMEFIFENEVDAVHFSLACL